MSHENKPERVLTIVHLVNGGPIYIGNYANDTQFVALSGGRQIEETGDGESVIELASGGPNPRTKFRPCIEHNRVDIVIPLAQIQVMYRTKVHLWEGRI